MMNRAERNEHHQKMREMKDRGQCQAYMAERHQKMMERAKERGRGMPAGPHPDACSYLPG
jgi:hypothetical protein